MASASGSDSTQGPARRDGVFFVTDPQFALPTIASALQVRRLVPVQRADIRILTTNFESDSTKRLRDFLASKRVFVDELPAALYTTFDLHSFNKTHVPTSTLGRFFMLDCVPDIYKRILYLDGDTWPCSDPSALLDADLPAGTIAAAEDQLYFFRKELGPTGARVRNYLHNLGLRTEGGYFNAGVLLADAASWRQICVEAFDFFRQNLALCLHHDQSAMNAVAGERRLRLSPRWNFASAYSEWGIKSDPPVAIFHFCGGGKPWAQLGHLFHETFAEAFKDLRELGFKTNVFSDQELAAMNGSLYRQRLKHRTVLLPRLMMRRRAYHNLVRASIVL